MISPEAAKVAAKWWADVLREGPKFDNGDVMQSAFATIAFSAKPRPPADQIDRFEKELAGSIESYRGDRLFFGCDYHPDWILSEPARVAGLDTNITDFPCKTYMHVGPDGVQVAYGYGKPYKKIYP